MYEDERGIIHDILFDVDCVTYITNKKYAVRGNHYHKQTEQHTYVLSGSLLHASNYDGNIDYKILRSGDRIFTPPGVPHAWRALEDAEVLVFTKGPRGKDYEKDTYRLEDKLINNTGKLGDNLIK